MRTFPLVLSAATGLVTACVHRPNTATSTVKIVGGQEVPAGDVKGTWTAALVKSDGHLICTAVLLYPDVLATAAHCVTAESMATGPQIVFGPRSRPTPDEHVYTVKGWYAHEKYDPKMNIWNNVVHDVALIYLDAPVPADVGTPIQVAPDSLQLVVNTTPVTLVGYGSTATTKGDGGLLRWTTTQELGYQAAYYFDGGSFAAPQGVCYGDSGGPAAVQDASGAWNVLGVAKAYLTVGTTKCESGEAVYTDLRLNRAWITAHRNYAGNRVAPPEPPPPPATATATGTATGTAAGGATSGDGADQDQGAEPTTVPTFSN